MKQRTARARIRYTRHSLWRWVRRCRRTNLSTRAQSRPCPSRRTPLGSIPARSSRWTTGDTSRRRCSAPSLRLPPHPAQHHGHKGAHQGRRAVEEGRGCRGWEDHAQGRAAVERGWDNKYGRSRVEIDVSKSVCGSSLASQTVQGSPACAFIYVSCVRHSPESFFRAVCIPIRYQGILAAHWRTSGRLHPHMLSSTTT